LAVLFRIIARRWMTKGATVQTITLSMCGHLSYKGGEREGLISRFRLDGRFFRQLHGESLSGTAIQRGVRMKGVPASFDVIQF